MVPLMDGEFNEETLYKDVDSVRRDGRDGEAPRNWQEREAIPSTKPKAAKNVSETQRKCVATEEGLLSRSCGLVPSTRMLSRSLPLFAASVALLHPLPIAQIQSLFSIVANFLHEKTSF